MNVEMIWAQDADCGIGLNGRLPWPHVAEDMKRFQEVTSGSDRIIVMGKRTHADILAAAKERGRKNKDIKKKGVLSGRTSIVLSTSETEFHGASAMTSLRDVFNEYQFTDKTIVVIGGEKLFIEAATWANTCHVTVFDRKFNCDRRLPTSLLNSTDWDVVPIERIPEIEGSYNAYFVELRRRVRVTVG